MGAKQSVVKNTDLIISYMIENNIELGAHTLRALRGKLAYSF